MSANMCYMSGYGVEIEDLLPLLNQEKRCEWENTNDIGELFKDITEPNEDNFISWFVSDDGSFLYIRDTSPYAPLFTGLDHINEYYYKKLKPYLNDDVRLEQLSKILDDVFSYDFC